MNRTLRLSVLAALAGWAGLAAAQEIQFFEHPDFSGRRFGANNSINNLADQGFNDRASSVVIRSGAWQLCSDAYFRGRCVTLQPGEYRNLAQIGLSNTVSSARELGVVPPGPGPGPGTGRGPAVTLYEDFNFRGTTLDVAQTLPNLARSEFNDRTRSLIVHEGTWELCRDEGFRGGCQTYGPGRHSHVARSRGRVVLLRPQSRRVRLQRPIRRRVPGSCRPDARVLSFPAVVGLRGRRRVSDPGRVVGRRARRAAV